MVECVERLIFSLFASCTPLPLNLIYPRSHLSAAGTEQLVYLARCGCLLICVPIAVHRAGYSSHPACYDCTITAAQADASNLVAPYPLSTAYHLHAGGGSFSGVSQRSSRRNLWPRVQ
jgi:hypothetical protein